MNNESLPFLNGKYIYWLLFLIIIALIKIFKSNFESIRLNFSDSAVLIMTLLGVLSFLYLSESTVYSLFIWNYTGYITFYILLRSSLNNYCDNVNALKILLYFCALTSLLNVILLYLQINHYISSSNKFFLNTGIFYSPNQLGIYLTIGFLASLYLLITTKYLWVKLTLFLTVLIIFVGIYLSESRGAFLSLFIAIIYYKKNNNKLNFNWKIGISLVLFLFCIAYIIFTLNINKIESTSGRYFTTLAVSKQIAQVPLGHGVNSFSVLYNKTKAEYFENNNNWEEVKNGGYIYSANNDVLELTYEMGIPWIVIFIVFIYNLYKKRDKRPEVLVCRTIILCLLFFSFTNNIYTIPIFVLIACFCAVFILNTLDTKIICQIKNLASYKYLAVGFVFFTSYIIFNRLNSEFKLYKFYQDKSYLKGVNQLENYLSKIDSKGEEKFMGGIILMKNGYQKQGVELLQAGFQLSGKPTLGRILATGLQKQKKFKQAEIIYRYNKNVEPYRFEARVDLFDLYIETDQCEKAKKIAVDIINLPVKIPSRKIIEIKLRAKLYIKSKGKISTMINLNPTKSE